MGRPRLRRRRHLVLALLALGTAQPDARAALLAPDDPWARDAALRAAEERPGRTFPLAWPRWETESERAPSLRAFAVLEAGRRARAPLGFGAPPRGDARAAAGVRLRAPHWDVQLRANAWRRVDHGPAAAPDGTWLAWGARRWAFFAGWVPQWWGPGWEGSLLLGNAARPRPTAGLLLRGTWLGGRGWELRMFLARLERARPVPAPLHWGMRLALRASDGLELDFERVAQICGRNRPCGLKSWARMLAGLDNAGQAGVTVQNQPGNQLGGLSLRWRSPVGRAPYAIYAQGAGEDEAGKLPSKWFWLAGAELWGEDWRAFLEYADTRAGAWYRRPELGTVYHHSVYRMGYAAWRRPLGFSLGGDARLWSLGALGHAHGLDWMAAARRWRLAPPAPGGARQQLFVHLRRVFGAGRLEVEGAVGDAAWAAVRLVFEGGLF